MLTEALEWLRERVQLSTLDVVTTGKNPHGYYLNKGASVDWVDAPEPDLAHKLGGAPDVVAFCERMSDLNPEVYVDENKIGVTLDDGRRDSAIVELASSTFYGNLRKLSNLGALPPVDLAERLRLSFWPHLPEEIYNGLRGVTFRTTDKSEVVATRGKHSLGNAVEQEAIGAGENGGPLPDRFEIKAPLYNNQGVDRHVAVEVLIEERPDERAYAVHLAPNSLESARLEVVRGTAKDIAKALPSLPVHVGAFGYSK